MNSSGKNLKVITTGTIHAAAPNGKTPICGAGNIGVGGRRRSVYYKTGEAVNCKKCLAKLTEQEIS